MRTPAAIEIQELSKKYRFGQRQPYATLRDAMANFSQQWWGKEKAKRIEENEFWALRNINLRIFPGEVIGVIGRNGAGKSTLLKILSRITFPTTGKVILRGRLGSLLEVGTGFHQELTGRENIYLNGSVLGMTHQQISANLKKIITFADISDFIDTPVKYYSSGMYVRLAFAVAAHLESDILLVDEVLAVGDAEFQKKCLGKIRDISSGGRTVLFVSHDLQTVQNLCSKIVWLENGRIKKIGKPAEVVQDYLHSIQKKMSSSLKDRVDRTGKGNLRLTSLTLLRGSKVTNNFAIGDHLKMKIRVQNITTRRVTFSVNMSLRDEKDVGLISCDSNLIGQKFSIPASSFLNLTCRLHRPPLNYGRYTVNLALLANEETEDWIVGAGQFQIQAGQYPGRVASNPFPVLNQFSWKSEEKNV